MNTWKYSFVLLIIFPVLASCDEVSPLSQGHCPKGWIDGSFVELGCLYFNHTEYMTWLDCLKYCQSFSWNDTAAIEIITAEVNYYSRKTILANTSKILLFEARGFSTLLLTLKSQFLTIIKANGFRQDDSERSGG